MDTVRLTKRQQEPVAMTVVWYRASEDLPMTSGAVLNEFGHKIFRRENKWMAMWPDSSYYEAVTPVWWMYIPKAPSLF